MGVAALLHERERERERESESARSLCFPPAESPLPPNILNWNIYVLSLSFLFSLFVSPSLLPSFSLSCTQKRERERDTQRETNTRGNERMNLQ